MPEQKRENGEGADVHSAARNSAEDSTEESNKQKHHCLPPAKIHDGVKCFPFMFSADRNKRLMSEKVPKSIYKLWSPVQKEKSKRKAEPDAHKS